MIKIINYIIISVLFLSCNSKHKIIMYHYKNPTDVNEQILASDLKIFFKNEKNIHMGIVKEMKFRKEFIIIKEKIQLIQNNVEPDDSYYEYAFINKNDTLYADYILDFWRYKNFGTTYKLNDTIKSKIRNFDGHVSDLVTE